MSLDKLIQWKCDECGEVAQAGDRGTYNVLPDEWVEVNYAGMAHTPSDQQHFCGGECLMANLDKRDSLWDAAKKHWVFMKDIDESFTPGDPNHQNAFHTAVRAAYKCRVKAERLAGVIAAVQAELKTSATATDILSRIQLILYRGTNEQQQAQGSQGEGVGTQGSGS